MRTRDMIRPPIPLEDTERLIAEHRAGDRLAFEALVGLHLRHLRAFLAWRLPDETIVDRVATNAWERACLCADRVPDAPEFETWLFGMGLEEARADLRENGNRGGWRAACAGPCRARLLTELDPAAAHAAYAKLLRNIRELPEEYAKLLELRYCHHKSTAAIAALVHQDHAWVRHMACLLRRHLLGSPAPAAEPSLISDSECRYVEGELDRALVMQVEERLQEDPLVLHEVRAQEAMHRFLSILCNPAATHERAIKREVQRRLTADSSPPLCPDADPGSPAVLPAATPPSPSRPLPLAAAIAGAAVLAIAMASLLWRAETSPKPPLEYASFKPEFSTFLEAENARYNALLQQISRGGSLFGFIQFGHRASEYAQWDVDVPRPGWYRITFSYSLIAGEASPAVVTTPSQPAPPSPLVFSSTGSRNAWARASTFVQLSPQTSSLRLVFENAPALRIDWMRIEGPFPKP